MRVKILVDIQDKDFFIRIVTGRSKTSYEHLLNLSTSFVPERKISRPLGLETSSFSLADKKRDFVFSVFFVSDGLFLSVATLSGESLSTVFNLRDVTVGGVLKLLSCALQLL